MPIHLYTTFAAQRFIMKKNIGLVIAVIGLLVVIGSVALTPFHAMNVGDSGNSTNYGSIEFFAGLITFGAGIVVFANGSAEEKENQKSK